MDSWNQLPAYLLEATPTLSAASSARTAGYTATNPPNIRLAPAARISDSILPPEDRILPRLLRALEHGLGLLPPGLEFPNVQDTLRCLNQETGRLIKNESEVIFQLVPLFMISRTLGLAISRAFNKNVDIQSDAPDSQVGGSTFVITDGIKQNTISVKLKQPNSLFRHRGATQDGLQTSSLLRIGQTAKNAEAMSITLALQMNLAQPTASRFGLLYAGPIFMLTESVSNPYGRGTILITSPLFSAVDAPLKTPFEASGLPTPLPCAPIIACLVTLMCQHLQEFEIDALTSPIPNLALPSTVKHGGGSSGGYGKTDADNEDSEHETSTHKTRSRTSMSDASSFPTSTSTTTVALGPALGNLSINILTSIPAINVAYDHPDMYNEPRLVIPVSIASSSPKNMLSSSPPSPSNPGRHLSSPMKTFLETIIEDTIPPEFTLCEPSGSSRTPETIVLQERLGQGRTGTVWRIASHEHESPKRVAKVMSCRHIASIARETLFYETIFPGSEVASLVPKYYGTYASVDGGWYLILLEDVGSPVEGEATGDFAQDNERLINAVRQLENAFANAGIEHGDVRPSNVLRAQDGSFRLIDFGYSYLESGELSGDNTV